MGYSLPQGLRRAWLLILIINGMILCLLLNFREYHRIESSDTDFNDVIVAPEIIVVYSGPTKLVDSNISKIRPNYGQSNNLKYHLNTAYFLKYGVQCETQDTLIVLTNETLPLYQDQIDDLDSHCNLHYQHRVLVATRNPSCYDLESVRLAVYDGVVNITKYSYFIFINCGVTGPAKELADIPWTKLFLDKLKGRVKMTGLTHNCFYPRSHIQSMMFALDQEALRIVMNGGAIFNCLQRWPDFNTMNPNVAKNLIVINYEVMMSQLILSSGYGFDPFLRSQVIFLENKSDCIGNDIWIGKRLKDLYKGRIPLLRETVFFKSTRYLSPALAKEIGFNIPIMYNWMRR
jgi:hypothetical protein